MDADLNLLVTLDVLLAEASVARAARRLQLSPSAMSRALARLREATGDPLLVRAGRGLVPTPRAIELRAAVGPLVEAAHAVLRPLEGFDPLGLVRIFTLRTTDGFAETFGPRLISRVLRDAPGVTLRFIAKPDKDSGPLRNGEVDLETGVLDATTGPEVRAQALFRDRRVGVVRAGHALIQGKVTAKAYARCGHILVARQGMRGAEIDEALEALGLKRRVVTIVTGFGAALSLARATDLVTSVPERHTAGLRDGLVTFVLPLRIPPMTVSMLWHPRMDADPAHRWLRACVREVCSG